MLEQIPKQTAITMPTPTDVSHRVQRMASPKKQTDTVENARLFLEQQNRKMSSSLLSHLLREPAKGLRLRGRLPEWPLRPREFEQELPLHPRSSGRTPRAQSGNRKSL